MRPGFCSKLTFRPTGQVTADARGGTAYPWDLLRDTWRTLTEAPL
jgi:hypothetical protein